jgi:hypothetical protein
MKHRFKRDNENLTSQQVSQFTRYPFQVVMQLSLGGNNII